MATLGDNLGLTVSVFATFVGQDFGWRIVLTSRTWLMKSPNVAVIFFAQNSLSHMSHPFGFSLSVWVCVPLSLSLWVCFSLSLWDATTAPISITTANRITKPCYWGKKCWEKGNKYKWGGYRKTYFETHLEKKSKKVGNRKQTPKLSHTRAFINLT